jgi:predicted secreted protein
MALCNTIQNEVGGKDLLLKKAKCFETGATTNNSSALTLTAHGAKVGDLIKFVTVGALTAVNTNDYYLVRDVTNANTITIRALINGPAVVFDAAETNLEILVYRNLGGLRSKEFGLSSEAVDITNVDSDEWSTMLDGAGVRSASFSGSGVWTNEVVFQEFFADFLANRLVNQALVDAKTGRVYAGRFKITELSVSGDYDAEGTYSVSGESSGPIDVFTFDVA